MVLEQDGCRAQIREEENKDGLKVIDIAVTGGLHQTSLLDSINHNTGFFVPE